MRKELYGVRHQPVRQWVPKPLPLPKVRPCLMSPAKGRFRLELPIDHFRLLGVGPTTDAQSVLRTLQQRLDRAPDQGFTEETLQSREELLRASADLLSDADRRLVYETDRVEEFAPIKNADGGDSAESSGRLQTERAARWMESAGLKIARNDDGTVNGRIEITSATALAAADLAGQMCPEFSPGGDLLF